MLEGWKVLHQLKRRDKRENLYGRRYIQGLKISIYGGKR